MAKNKSEQAKKTEIQILPNPEAPRLPVVDACEGCSKVYLETNVCMIYADPSAIQRLGCAFNYKATEEEVKKVNPLKASKKKKKGR